MDSFDFLRISAVSPPLQIANPRANRLAMEKILDTLTDSDIVLFPELSLCGYTCGDLFGQSTLLEACLEELTHMSQSTTSHPAMIVVGLPLRSQGKLYNVAAALHHGRLLGLVPKQFIPNYKEFYEERWFVAADGTEPSTLSLAAFADVPFGTDLLFQAGPATIGIEICEDLWMPIPPSSQQALQGANVLLNLSASNQTVGKSAYRTQLVTTQSGRCCAAYAYASSGPSESSSDIVFSGHCLIAENGSLLQESTRVGTGLICPTATSLATVDIDLQRIAFERQGWTSFHRSPTATKPSTYRCLPFPLRRGDRKLCRQIPGQPFVPQDNPESLAARCREIFEIQCAGLAKRLSILPASLPLVIGISGGLDSTLALLVATQALQHLKLSPKRIHGITMPGFGTTTTSLENSQRLMHHLGVQAETIDIRQLCLQTFRDMNHQPFGISVASLDLETFQKQLEQLPNAKRHDLVFENVQARVRTLLLMNRGFVLGTGDLSEQALGWSTYNGDHMSMYNVNTSIPKTLVRFLVRYVATQSPDPKIVALLNAIADAPISPELLPLAADGSLHQATEVTIGPYELHDFFLFHWIRNGASPEKLRMLASHAHFSQPYPPALIDRTLATFLQRFFANQFKRNCVPDGPKVGSVSLSPRGDWRMPSDADPSIWLEKPPS